MDRLGNSSEAVRGEAGQTLLALLRSNPSDALLEKLGPAFAHRSWRLRTEIATLAATAATELDLDEEQRKQLLLSPLLKLLEDSNQ